MLPLKIDTAYKVRSKKGLVRLKSISQFAPNISIFIGTVHPNSGVTRMGIWDGKGNCVAIVYEPFSLFVINTEDVLKQQINSALSEYDLVEQIRAKS